MVAVSPGDRKKLIAWFVVRYIALGVLALSLIFQIINPILDGVLIVAVLVGSNVSLRLLAQRDRVDIILYLTYVSIMLGLAGLWLLSIITTLQAAVVFFPTIIIYLIFSWTRTRRPHHQ